MTARNDPRKALRASRWMLAAVAIAGTVAIAAAILAQGGSGNGSERPSLASPPPFFSVSLA